MKKQKIIKKIVYPIIWIAIWQILSLIIGNKIIFVGPYETILALYNLIQTGDFWLSVLSTLLRITCGYLIGVILGILVSSVSYRFKYVDDFISPVLMIMKAVPVASFVVIFLIWMGNENLSIIISSMIVFPIIYASTLTGLKNVSVKMLEMSKVYKMSFIDKVRYLYYPEIREQTKTSLVLSSGMSWKSGVAAEVIAQPLLTIGNSMYVAKIYLDTDRLFAWTVVIIVISKFFEFLISKIVKGGKKNDKT